MCGLSVTFCRSPLWARRGRVVHRYREGACVKTSGEHVMETRQTHIAVPGLLLEGREGTGSCRSWKVQEIVVIGAVARLKVATGIAFKAG